MRARRPVDAAAEQKKEIREIQKKQAGLQEELDRELKKQQALAKKVEEARAKTEALKAELDKRFLAAMKCGRRIPRVQIAGQVPAYSRGAESADQRTRGLYRIDRR